MSEERVQERIKNVLTELELTVDAHISELRAVRTEIASLRSKNIQLMRDIEILSIETTSLKHELETMRNSARLHHEHDNQQIEQNTSSDNDYMKKVHTSLTSHSNLINNSSDTATSDNLLNDNTTNEIEISITQLKDLLERRKKVNSVR